MYDFRGEDMLGPLFENLCNAILACMNAMHNTALNGLQHHAFRVRASNHLVIILNRS